MCAWLGSKPSLCFWVSWTPCVCFLSLSVFPSLAAVISQSVNFSRSKSQQMLTAPPLKATRAERGASCGEDGPVPQGEDPVGKARTTLAGLALSQVCKTPSTQLLPSRCLLYLFLRKGAAAISPAVSILFLSDTLRAGACLTWGDKSSRFVPRESGSCPTAD